MPAIPPELLTPACGHKPDPLSRMAVADWLEEQGEDGEAWRWLALTGKRPHRMRDVSGYAWTTFVLIEKHPHSAVAESPFAAVPEELYAALEAATLDTPAPTPEAAYEALAAAWPLLPAGRRSVMMMAAGLHASVKAGRLRRW